MADFVLSYALFVGLALQGGGAAEIHILLRDSMAKDSHWLGQGAGQAQRAKPDLSSLPWPTLSTWMSPELSGNLIHVND